MNKQTAVEWLYQLSKQRELDKFDLEQAKEMEKQQIEDAFLAGGNSVFNFQRGNSFQTIENYTEQTFKSE